MSASINAMRDRNERATREATTIIEAEQKARVEKTERLRALRLAQETKPKKRGKAYGKPKA
jgi:hypothetical protein